MKILKNTESQRVKQVEWKDLRLGLDEDRLAELEGQVYKLKEVLRSMSDRIARLEYRE